VSQHSSGLLAATWQSPLAGFRLPNEVILSIMSNFTLYTAGRGWVKKKEKSKATTDRKTDRQKIQTDRPVLFSVLSFRDNLKIEIRSICQSAESTNELTKIRGNRENSDEAAKCNEGGGEEKTVQCTLGHWDFTAGRWRGINSDQIRMQLISLNQ